eukprot:1161296-Pelagomonas_calceolata.AAC.10
MGSAFSQARQMAHAGLSSMLERLQPQKRSPSWNLHCRCASACKSQRDLPGLLALTLHSALAFKSFACKCSPMPLPRRFVLLNYSFGICLQSAAPAFALSQGLTRPTCLSFCASMLACDQSRRVSAPRLFDLTLLPTAQSWWAPAPCPNEFNSTHPIEDQSRRASVPYPLNSPNRGWMLACVSTSPIRPDSPVEGPKLAGVSTLP